MENTTNERASIQIERPSLQVFSQADIDAGRTGERDWRGGRNDREPAAEEAQP